MIGNTQEQDYCKGRKMEPKVKRINPDEWKNHKGNYGISVSFDAFGECSDKVANKCVSELEQDMKVVFANWQRRYCSGNVCSIMKLKSVKWNE